MLTLELRELPCDEQTLRAALTQYKAELEAHKTTVGVPAPWPDYDILRLIVVTGGDFQVRTTTKEEIYRRNGDAFVSRRIERFNKPRRFSRN